VRIWDKMFGGQVCEKNTMMVKPFDKMLGRIERLVLYLSALNRI
jgi:hypothetical protein